jgi:hypothetical protein
MRPCQAHIANPALGWTAKGACRALLMHCIRGGDVASRKQVGRWTPTMQPIVTSHQKQPRHIHFPEQPRQRLSNTINSTIFFTSFSTKTPSPKFCSCHFPYSGFRTRQVGRPTWYLLRALSLFFFARPISRYRRSSAGFILRKEGACSSDSRAIDWSHSFNIRFVVVAQRYQCALNRAKYGEKRTQRGTPSCSGCILRASEHCVCV